MAYFKRLRTPKWLKNTLIILGVLFMLFFIFLKMLDQPLPQGEEGQAAELLTDKMLEAVGYQEWMATEAVSWTFANHHHYLWDKNRHWVEASWGDYRAVFDANTLKGIAWKGEIQLEGPDGEKAVDTAWKYWINDSFWLNAPVKARDPGTLRKLVRLESGEDALLVSYTSGGVTPGDSYLWLLDDQGRPRAWQLWVKILPVGGITFSWEQWQTLSTGASVATTHVNPFTTLQITNVRGTATLQEWLAGKEDPFAPLAEKK